MAPYAVTTGQQSKSIEADAVAEKADIDLLRTDPVEIRSNTIDRGAICTYDTDEAHRRPAIGRMQYQDYLQILAVEELNFLFGIANKSKLSIR
jgi:hypothetical protein